MTIPFVPCSRERTEARLDGANADRHLIDASDYCIICGNDVRVARRRVTHVTQREVARLTLYRAAELMIHNQEWLLDHGGRRALEAGDMIIGDPERLEWFQVPELLIQSAEYSSVLCQGAGDLVIAGLQVVRFPLHVRERMRAYYCDGIDPTLTDHCGLQSVELVGVADDGAYLYGDWEPDAPNFLRTFWLCGN